MSSSPTSTSNLRQLIQTVRQAKTATEERSIIQREGATIRHMIGTGNPSVKERSRCVLKLAYISMLGYSTEFAQMQVVTLMAESDFVAKRVAYLALSILLDERQEVLTLAENHLKRDLTSGNALIQCLALDAVANLAGEDMVHDVIGDVTSLLDNTSPSVRRKACLVSLRIVKKVPGAAEAVLDKLINCTAERNHGVLISALGALTECMDVISTTGVVDKIQDRVPVLVTLLKSLILSAYATEYDVGAVADPFLQCAILRFFTSVVSIVATVEADNNNSNNNSTSNASSRSAYHQSVEVISDILAQVATNTDGQRNVGCAVLYECVRTIGAMKNNLADDGLRVLAVNILGRFVLNKDNNIRYVALSTLKSWIAREGAAVQRHRMTIMECLRDSDLSLRRKALELTVALVNADNVRAMVPDLISYLGVCSPELKPDACAMLCDVVEQFSPTSEWRVETSLRLFAVGESAVPVQFGLNFVGLLTRLSSSPSAPTESSHDILKRAVTALWTDVLVPASAITNSAAAVNHSTENEASSAVTSHLLQRETAILVAVWSVGEFASSVLLPAMQSQFHTAVTLDQVYFAMASLFEESESSLLQQYVLTAAIKLVAKNPVSGGGTIAATVRPLFDRAATSLDCELQQRACEYLFLLSNPELASAAFSPKMPCIPERVKNNTSSFSSAPIISLAGVGAGGAGSQQQGGSRSAKSNFDDIFGGGPSTASPTTGSNTNSANANRPSNTVDIFGSGSNTGISKTTVASNGTGFDDIFGGGSNPAPTLARPVSVASPPPAVSLKKFEAFSNSDLSATFTVKPKVAGSYSSVEVEAYVKTSGVTNIEDLVFFVSVLKTMQVQLSPAVTTTIHASNNNGNGGLGTLVQKFTVDAVNSGGTLAPDVGAVFQARVRVSYSSMGNAKNEIFTVSKDLKTI